VNIPSKLDVASSSLVSRSTALDRAISNTNQASMTFKVEIVGE
jgi:hypothetical protein